jgi:hypothetical protein
MTNISQKTSFLNLNCNSHELVEPQRRQERKELKLKPLRPLRLCGEKIFNNL